MATHSSIIAWKIPWTEEPGRLQSHGVAEADTTERLTLSTLSSLASNINFRFIIKGNTVWHLLQRNSQQDVIIVRLLKTKERNLKSSNRKMTPDLYGKNSLNNRRFLIKNQVTRRKWHNIFQVLEEKNCQREQKRRYPLGKYRREDTLQENIEEKIPFRKEKKSRHSH